TPYLGIANSSRAKLSDSAVDNAFLQFGCHSGKACSRDYDSHKAVSKLRRCHQQERLTREWVPLCRRANTCITGTYSCQRNCSTCCTKSSSAMRGFQPALPCRTLARPRVCSPGTPH